MQKKFLLLFLLLWNIGKAQKSYFQQQSDYTIDVSLDDKNHILRGFERINYVNHSPDTLRFLFFHLWPNAYKNDRSAYTEQMIENGKTSFYFSEAIDKGFIDSLNFEVDEHPVNISNFNNYEDVILIELLSPLLPGKQIVITTPFRVVIPKTFSRMGHDGQDYQINQWYPKPAVYDQYGWHPMPYLEQGEFYSEFGKFDVTITVPKPYWVAATGVLTTPSEQAAIEERIQSKEGKSIDQSGMKTLHYTQDSIHDFAWFASKQFIIEKTFCSLPSGKKINCYSYYKEANKKKYEKSSEIVAKTIQFYSEQVGEYPYAHATVVDGTTQEGAGGMEYPMVTNIGSIRSRSELQTVIIHEVGHNWFYGILGNNERDYAWMDESMNSFYEHKLDAQLIQQAKSDSPANALERKMTDQFGQAMAYQLSAQQHDEQAIELPSTHFTAMNYGSMIYAKAPFLMNYLEAYMGEEKFKQTMQEYFRQWQFKHPYPNDVRLIFEKSAGSQLNWFFDDILKTTTPIDFKITSVHKGQIMAKSTTNFKGPIPISAYNKGEYVGTAWTTYPYTTPVVFENKKVSTYAIGFNSAWADNNPRNDFYKTNGLFHRYKLALKPGTKLGLTQSHILAVLPALGYNVYDQFMLGLTLHNIQLPNRAFQYALAPMYSFGSKDWVGTGVMAYTFFPKIAVYRLNLGIEGKSFHDNTSSLNIAQPLFTRYIKVAPFLSAELKPAYPRSKVRNHLLLKYYHILQQSFEYTRHPVDSLFRPNISAYRSTSYLQVNWLHQNKRILNPFSYQWDAHGNASFIKLSFTGNLKVDYHLNNKALYVRLFAGKFFDLNNSRDAFLLRNQYLTSTSTAANDYLFNETYFARNEQDGWLAQQIAPQEGGMKIRTAFLANPIGINNQWLTALNFRSDLPIKSTIKLQLFLDVAGYHNADQLNPSGAKVIYTAGAELHLFSDLLCIYAPMILSKDLKDYTKSNYSTNRFLQTMSFSLNLKKINWLNTQSILTSLQ